MYDAIYPAQVTTTALQEAPHHTTGCCASWIVFALCSGNLFFHSSSQGIGLFGSRMLSKRGA